MTWLSTGWPRVLELAWTHMLLGIPAIFLSIVVAIPLGRLAHGRPRLAGLLLGAASLLYAIPALPMLIIIPFLFGFPPRSPATLVVALGLYGSALLVRTSTDAFASIDAQVRQTAIATGHASWAIFWRVELPLALPVLVSGIRVVTVSTIGLATISALIGIPSLGSLFTDGFQRGIGAEVTTGIVAVVVLAILLDVLCLLVGRHLTPWSRPEFQPKPSREHLTEAGS